TESLVVVVVSEAHTEGQVFGRAFLQYILGLDVPLVLFAFTQTVGGDVVTFDVTGHEAQARNAVGRHVQVVASLPGAFVTAHEVGDLNGVGYEDCAVTIDTVVVTIVTAGALVSDGELVSAEGIGSCQAPQFVVYAFGAVADHVNLVAALVAFGFITVEVEVQGLAFCDWQGVVQVDVLLLEVFINLGCSQRTGEVIGEGIACAEDVGSSQASAAIAV